MLRDTLKLNNNLCRQSAGMNRILAQQKCSLLPS